MKRKLLWAGFILSALSTVIFGILLFTDIGDTQTYVVLDKRGATFAIATSMKVGSFVNQNKGSNIVTIKSNGVKVYVNQPKSEDVIIEPNFTYKAFSGCAPPSQPCEQPPTQPTNPVPAPAGPQVEDWGRKRVEAGAAWSVTDGSSIGVCILDTGIDKSHPDLKHVTGRSFVGGDYADMMGHGTHVAGTIAAINNNFGVIGVSQAKLYIGKVLGDSGQGTLDGIAQGIQWCISTGAKVISMSLGGPDYSQILEYAVNQAIQAGITVVAAAGNGGPNDYTNFPARFNGVVAVGATDQNNQMAQFSSRGKIQVCAPGVQIVSTMPVNGCQICGRNTFQGPMDGTSMATPHVSAVVALGLAVGKPLQTIPGPIECGAGIVNAKLTVGAKQTNLEKARKYFYQDKVAQHD